MGREESVGSVPDEVHGRALRSRRPASGAQVGAEPARYHIIR
jgi:hypothetical protein